jgi:hypothetical protein
LKITIKTSRQINECRSDWDDFLPGCHHLKSKHLQAFENANIDAIDNYYVQIFVKEKLIGLAYLQLFQFQHKHLNFNKAFVSKLIKIILPAQLPLLVCGHLFRVDFQGFYFKGPSQQSLIFEAIELFKQENKNCQPCGIIIKDCKEVFAEQSPRLLGYRFFNGDVTMEISRRNHWVTFDDYLKDLQKKYLQRAKKILQALAGIEKRELDAGAIFKSSAEIERLYWNVVNKQTIKLGTVNAAYFVELKNDLQHNFEFHALYRDGIMVGFYTFIFYDAAMETHYIGLDYEANKVYKIYFNILFAAIKKMIERQDATLELGRTAREAKISAGALPKQIINYVSIKNKIASITVNYFLKRFNQSEDGEMLKRTPLK